jgi:hypothetical protein
MLEPTHKSVYEFNYNHIINLSELEEDAFATLLLKEEVLYTLALNGISNISVQECSNLLRFKGLIIELNALCEISNEVAEKLITFNGALSLGLETLNLEVAKTLAMHSAAMSLNKIKSVSIEALEYLANYQGNVLELDALEFLSLEQAKTIATFKGEYLSLNGLKDISVEVAIELSKYHGFVFQSGLKNMPKR